MKTTTGYAILRTTSQAEETDKFPLFPKVPNAVKTLESSLNASAYEQGLADRENGTSYRNHGNEDRGYSRTRQPETLLIKRLQEKTNRLDLDLEVVGLAIGTAYLLRRKR